MNWEPSWLVTAYTLPPVITGTSLEATALNPPLISLLTLPSLYFKIHLFIYLFIYLWLCWVFVAVHKLFSSCSEQWLLFVAVPGLLIAVASLVAEHRL